MCSTQYILIINDITRNSVRRQEKKATTELVAKKKIDEIEVEKYFVYHDFHASEFSSLFQDLQ
jgi:hypothetical protein